MNFDSLHLQSRLQELESIAGPPERYVVAFSGGMDSSVLLHAMTGIAEARGLPLLAAHVDHGLHEDSARWDSFCRGAAEAVGVEYVSHRVKLDRQAGSGPEASARDARYAWLGGQLRHGDWLLSAHHENDQAETLLLNLLRGSGVTGLAGMGAVRRFSNGYLVRPLLGVPGAALRAYADQHQLRWIDDPSNEDTNLDRNFLRLEILPRLATRWPAVAARMRRSADLAAEASELLLELADHDLDGTFTEGRLDIHSLAGLSGPRLRNALRRAVMRCGLPPVPASRLYQVEHELIPARDDAQPRVSWPGGEMRRFRDYLYILPSSILASPARGGHLLPGGSLDLGPGNGRLVFEHCDSGGIAESAAVAGIEVRYRQGGESIRLPNHAKHRKLKKLLQEEGIVPWMRDRMPLLYAGERLVAVADLWIDADFHTGRGYAPRWIDHPALY